MDEMFRLLTLQGQLGLLVIIGMLLGKIGIIDKHGRKCLTDLVIDVILPCNIVQSFRIEFSWELLRNTRSVLIVSILLQLGCALICKFAYNRYGYEKRAVLQYGTVCSNAGFLGNSLAEGLFGSEGLLLTSVYLIPQRIAMWSVGVSYFMQGDAAVKPEERGKHRRQVFLKTITHPCIVAVAIGAVLMMTQLPLPQFIGNTVKSIGSCNIAVSMILIGAIMSTSDWHGLLHWDIVFYCLIRLGLIPLAVLAGCKLCGMGGLVTGVSVVLAAMPMGGTCAVLAEKYKGDAVFAGKCVAVSTLLSLVTTPLWCIVV